MRKVKTILSLTSQEALEFLMKSEQYHCFELPIYYDFDQVLQFVVDTVGEKSYEECLSVVRPEDLDNVNLDIVLNKDGKYAVRPLVLANPYLYYFLVRAICNETSWSAMLKCFESYKVPHLTSCAMPVVPNGKEVFHKSATILNWWNVMEQRSLELSLEYRYMFVTDITNCYGSIIPQSIDWALSCKGTQREDNSNVDLSKEIQGYLCAMQSGHNIGIPQGSTLFDFIGEIVLGYSDLLLYEALEREGISDYEIIRYRDDYRVFSNDRDKLEKISYILQHVLETLNFRLNPQKTRISDSIVTDSIKPDKLWYIYNTPILSHKNVDFDSLEKHLLYILLFGRDYPNSGQLKTLLSAFDKRLIEKLRPAESTGFTITVTLSDEVLKELDKVEQHMDNYEPIGLGGSVKAITAVAVQIALENVSVTNYALRSISRMIESLKDEDKKQELINIVYNKLCNQPNSDYNQLWLQNITYKADKSKNVMPYTVRLCRVVMGEDVQLWNNDWLKEELIRDFPQASVVKDDNLPKLSSVINFRERGRYSDDLGDDYLDDLGDEYTDDELI